MGWRPASAPIDLLGRWTRTAYDDRPGGGRSTAELLPGKRFMLAWKTSPGARWPYAGAGAVPDSGLTDLSRSARLDLRWRPRHGNSILFAFLRDIPGLTTPQNPNSRQQVGIEFVPETEWTSSRIPLSGFSVPLWWYKLNGLQPGPAPRLDRVQSFIVAAGESAKLDLGDTLEIDDLRLVAGPAHPVAGTLCGIAFLVVAVALFPRRRERSCPGAVPAGDPSSIPSSRREILWDYLRSNYRNPKLDLAITARETGLGEHRIGEILRGENLAFRQALSDMRLQEARRLLAESELQISEIAWQSGFGNVSHFNRVFKAKFGTTPSAFRRPDKASPTV
jgi:AraC-like DNA-binding protein